jgi:hypothetical protein
MVARPLASLSAQIACPVNMKSVLAFGNLCEFHSQKCAVAAIRFCDSAAFHAAAAAKHGHGYRPSLAAPYFTRFLLRRHFLY